MKIDKIVDTKVVARNPVGTVTHRMVINQIGVHFESNLSTSREEAIEFLRACLEELGADPPVDWAKTAGAWRNSAGERIISRLQDVSEQEPESLAWVVDFDEAINIVREECGLD